MQKKSVLSTEIVSNVQSQTRIMKNRKKHTLKSLYSVFIRTKKSGDISGSPDFPTLPSIFNVENVFL